MPIFNIAGDKNEYGQSSVSLTANDNSLENSYFGTLVYEAQKRNESCKITFSFNEDEIQITFKSDFAPFTKTSCLILCGIALAGPILDCYRNNKGNWKGFKKCLEEKGNELGTSALVCIANCI